MGWEFARTAAFWDGMASEFFRDGVTRRAEWRNHPAAAACRAGLLGGQSSSGSLLARFPGKIDRALGAGCGRAEFELGLLRAGAVEHFDLCDVSGASLQVAQDRADELGLTGRVSCFAETCARIARTGRMASPRS